MKLHLVQRDVNSILCLDDNDKDAIGTIDKDKAEEIIKRVNTYEKLQSQNRELVKKLEETVEELENVYGRETDFTESIRDLLEKIEEGE